MTKEVLALDIDDVVVKQVENFILWSNRQWGTNLTIEDYTEAWHELWGIDLDETENRKKMYFTDEVIGNLEAMEGADEALTIIAGLRKVIAVTSRRESLRPTTERALELIAPGTVDDIIFATYFQGNRKITRSKADICTEITATHLIDDHLKHCLAVDQVGIDSTLFGDYPWNTSTEVLPSGIVRAKNWQEVLQRLNIIDEWHRFV